MLMCSLVTSCMCALIVHEVELWSICYAHVPKDERRKLDSKVRKCMLLGYGDCVKGYRLYDVTRSKVIHSRDVIFGEPRDIQFEIPPSRNQYITTETHEQEEATGLEAEDEQATELPVEEAEQRRSGPITSWD